MQPSATTRGFRRAIKQANVMRRPSNGGRSSMLVLSPAELESVTGKTRKSSQCHVLAQLGIPYKIRPDGTPVVLRAAMEASFGHAPTDKGPSSPRIRVPKARGVLLRQE
ncbi:DUF4224 domain-containing protein [Paracandidimonas lactea]|uniref:DUF4224 domain-containing protein n=1 Tax=Paracandidimonas lactea TaxID=2895524 RepID=UPI0034E1DEC4